MTDQETVAALLARRSRLLGPAYRVLYDVPLRPVRGEGVWLEEADGRRVLDCYNNVPSVGHCHPRVVEALSRQAARLNTHTRYLHDSVLDYAERLLATMPGEIGNVMFTCTGSEANDLAVRVARSATGASGFIVTANAYHGVTAALAEMSPSLGAGVTIGDHVRTVAVPDIYRQGAAGAAAAFTRSVEEAVASLAAAGLRPAALLLDTVFASDGIHLDPPGFIAGAVAAVRRAGGLYIADEVQAGLGRTGEHMWGFERHGIVPDLVTVGKPMGDGHPVAALLARPEHLAAFGAGARYFNTFGGNPVSAAVGLAVLDVIRDEGLLENAARTGRLLHRGIAGLAGRHPAIGDVRSAGLYMGIEIVSDPVARTPWAAGAGRLVNALREAGVLVGLCAAAGNVIKLRPPLPFGPAEAGIVVDRMDAALAGLTR